MAGLTLASCQRPARACYNLHLDIFTHLKYIDGFISKLFQDNIPIFDLTGIFTGTNAFLPRLCWTRYDLMDRLTFDFDGFVFCCTLFNIVWIKGSQIIANHLMPPLI